MKNLIKNIIGIENWRKIKAPFQRWYLFHFEYKERVSYTMLSMGRQMDWENPQTLDEKIQWLKFNSDTRIWSRLTDKYAVRKYVQEKGLGDILVPLYGRWKSVDKVNWDSLPNEFVMKLNNGSGDCLICNDKKSINIKEWSNHFKRELKRKHGTEGLEPHYFRIKPCIIAEKLLDVYKQSIETSSLIDYKVWCINGVAEYIYTCLDRTKESVQVMIYDRKWNMRPEMCVGTPHYQIAKTILPPPISLEKMLHDAELLAAGFPQVRVDFYEVDGQIYFGEMTFTSMAGFMFYLSEQCEKEMGEKIDLTLAPKKKWWQILF